MGFFFLQRFRHMDLFYTRASLDIPVLIEHISRHRFVLKCLLLCVSVCACLYLAMCSFGHAVMSVFLVVFLFELFFGYVF